MDIIEILKSEYLSILFGGFAGIVTAWITQRVLNKRGVFGYFVTHDRVGMSTEDDIFGNVQVTWNKGPIQDLYLSTIELKNESLNDYDDVIVQIYTTDTDLLTEQTQILNTPNALKWSDNYKEKVRVEEGEEELEDQSDIYFSQREYIIPIFNRGQTAKLTYLNAPKTPDGPSIWLSVQKKGVRVKYRIPQNKFLGVTQWKAACAGIVIGIIGIFPLVYSTSNNWVLVISALVYGFFALVPGAYLIKLIKSIRKYIGR